MGLSFQVNNILWVHHIIEVNITFVCDYIDSVQESQQLTYDMITFMEYLV